MSSNPVRLHKKEEKSHNFSPFLNNFDEKLEGFVLSHASFFFLLTVVAGGIVFVWLCYAIVGVSAVESGGMRNFIAGGV